MSRPYRTLVPGRRIIDEDQACAMIGYDVHQSYMDDVTEVEEENATILDDTMERQMRKAGKSEIEIALAKRQITLDNLDRARQKLKQGMRGATSFPELIKKYDDCGAKENSLEKIEEHTFAVPNAPADVARAKYLSSTPKNPNHTSRSFRCLDISQVMNTEISLLNVSNPPVSSHSNKNNVDKTNEKEATEGSIQNTFTKEKGQSDGTLQGTYTKNQDTEKSIQGTFTKEQGQSDGTLQGTFTKEQPQIDGSVQGTFTKEQSKEESIQGTFTKEKDPSGSTLQGTVVRENAEVSETSGDKNTFVVDASSSNPENTFTVPNNDEFLSKNPKKSQREKRNISLANSMLESSMLNVVNSPGAQYFIRRPKKLRPSTDSQDKSRTIQMETINETNTGEQTGLSSYVDAMSEDDSQRFEAVRHITPTVENKRTEVSNVDNIRKTPTRNYLKPTFSSIQKSASKNNKQPVLADAAQYETPVSTPTRVFTNVRTSSLSNRIRQHDIEEIEEENMEKEQEGEEEDSVGATAVITQGEPVDFSNFQPSSSEQASIHRIERTLDVLNIRDPIENFTMDDVGGLDDDGDDDDDEEEEDLDESARTPQRLLEGSLASINTPGFFVNPRTRARRNYEDTTHSDSFEARSSDSESAEMILAKRKLIKPTYENDDGLRRSSRTRVKPLRTWLGEQAVYEKSPMGSKRLVGVTDVVIKDKRMIKYKSADPKVILERQWRAREERRKQKKERAAKRRSQLAKDHSRGVNLDTTQEDIVTSEDDE